MQRLSRWYEEANAISNEVVYDSVFVDEESFHFYNPTTFQHLIDAFTEYKT